MTLRGWGIGFLIFVLCLAITSKGAPSAPSSSPTSAPADHLRIFLATFGPGADCWEKFGHDAIVVLDTGSGEAIAYNWGVFDFGDGVRGFAAFAWKFVQGRLMYSMRSEPADDMFDEYKEANRSILLQELNFTATQKIDLQQRLLANDTDANRFYLYDYFLKNCSTMTRDAIDKTVDGRVHAQLDPLPTGTTYRWHDRRTSADTPWLYLFLDFALGRPVDRPLSEWEESFLPAKLAEHLTHVRASDGRGKLVPLIGPTQKLSQGIYPDRAAPPASAIDWLAAIGIGIGLLLIGLGKIARYRLARWTFNFIVMFWSLLAGALGGLLVFAWFTNHEAAKWNENLLQGNPISLLLVILVPMAVRWPRAAIRTALTVSIVSAVGVIAKLTPLAWQSNGPIIALALPIHLAIACALYQRARVARLASHVQ